MKNKKATLVKGIDSLTENQFKNLIYITGGDIPVVVPIYYPTRQPPRDCPEGMVWSNTLGRCVSLSPIAVAVK